MTAIHWKSGVSGNFDDASSWSTATVPTSADDALIDASGTYTVESLITRTVHSLTMATGASLEIEIGDFTFDFFGDDTNNGTIDVYSHLTVFGALDNTGVIRCFGAPIPNVPPHPLAYFQTTGTSTNSGTIEAINDAVISFNISPVVGPVSFTNYGIIGALGGSIITIGGNFGATSSFTNVGTIEALGHGSFVDLFATAGAITNLGHLVADGGTIQISNPNSVGGSGTAEIRNGGTLFIETWFAENTTFDPEANGTLQLGFGAVFSGALSGFTTGDWIDFSGLQYGGSTLTFDSATNILTVSNGANAPTIHLTGSYVVSGFQLSADVSGFAQVTYAPPSPTNHPPVIDATNSSFTGSIGERLNTTGSLALDIANGTITFTDLDLTDRPTSSVVHQQLLYRDAQGTDDTSQLTSAQVAAFENVFLPVPEVGNTNTGKIDWGYTINDSALDFLGVGESISVTSTVRIDDGHGGTVDQEISVTISGTNDKPLAATDFSAVSRGGVISSNVLTNDSDPDAHDQALLHVSTVNGTSIGAGMSIQGSYGVLSIGSDGNYTYSQTTKLPANLNAADLFNYTISDSHGATADAVLDINVLAQQGSASSILDIAKSFIGSSWGNENCTGFVYTVSALAHAPFFDRDKAVNNQGAYGTDISHMSLLNDTHSSNSFDFSEPISNIQKLPAGGVPIGGVQLPDGYTSWVLSGSTLVSAPSESTFVYDQAGGPNDAWRLVGGTNGSKITTINPNDPSTWPKAGDIFRGVVIENATAKDGTHELITHAGIVSSYDPVHGALTLIDNYAHTLNGHDSIGATVFNLGEVGGGHPAILGGYYAVYHDWLFAT